VKVEDPLIDPLHATVDGGFLLFDHHNPECERGKNSVCFWY
jgi:hypothetical protein